ncbi:MAG: hypothetical protein JKY14_03320 [Paraglaciecola sp.]|nr:hypothetical protein [Paraglaciecola sp.]
MGFNDRLIGQYVVIKGQFVAVFLTVLSLIVFSLPAQALEIGVNGHQATEYETQGYSIFISDNFSRRSPFYWSLGFSRYDEVYVEWNDQTLKFPLNNVEVALSYQPKTSSRSPKMRRFSMEYQVGAALALTENKFTWPELGAEQFFSEKFDVNGFLAISAHYKFSSNTSASLGVKHFPKMSEFGSISSVFLGFKFNFNTSQRYYGN